VRFGDPETQAVLPLLESDLFEVAMAVCDQRLERVELKWSDRIAVGVVMSAPGYPGAPQTGIPLVLPHGAAGVHVFHAGTAYVDGELVSAGGRVLTVVATADTLEAARTEAYALAGNIEFEGAHYRSDIGA